MCPFEARKRPMPALLRKPSDVGVPVLETGQDEGDDVSDEDRKSLGKYQLIERLAIGELVDLYRARVESIGGFARQFAIKMVRPELVGNDTYRKLIEQEARRAARLSHGHIVQLLDIGRDDGALYLVMEYVRGWNLSDVLKACRAAREPMPIDVAVQMGLGILRALAYAHALPSDGPGPDGILHHDLSPTNILFSETGQVKVADFGISKASLALMSSHPQVVRRSFDYVSPEQAEETPLTAASDLFQFGVVMFEALTLHHPFRGKGDFDTIVRIQKGTHPPMADLRDDVPSSLASLVQCCMAPQPSIRGTAEERVRELQAIAKSLGIAEDAATTGAWLARLLGVQPPDELDLLSAQARAFDAGELEELPENPDRTQPSKVRYLDADRGDIELLDDDADDERSSGSLGHVNLPHQGPAPRHTAVGWALACLLGILVGGTVTFAVTATGPVTENPSALRAAAPQPAEASLEVRLPAGLEVAMALDGAPLYGRSVVAPGAHRVVLTREHGDPLVFEVVVAAGEHRVLWLEHHVIDNDPPQDAVSGPSEVPDQPEAAPDDR